MQKKIVEKYPILGSSVDPDEVSMTIKGVGLGLIPVVIAIAKISGADEITETMLVELINSIATIASFMLIFAGIIRKISNKFLR